MRWELARLPERIGDAQRGINTLWARPPGVIDPTADSVRYEAVSYYGLAKIAAHLTLSPSDIFYDIGCGAGRVVCYYASFGIAECIGIELDPALAAKATLNAKALRNGVAPIEIRQVDATMTSYAKGTIYFLFNPFSAPLLKKVEEKFRAERAGTAITIVYVHPVHAWVLDEATWLRRRGPAFQIPHVFEQIDVVIWESQGASDGR